MSGGVRPGASGEAASGLHASAGARASFFFDLGSPECWIAAERVIAALPEVPVFAPVEAGSLADGLPEPDLETIARRAWELDLLPFRPPATLPRDTRPAMLAATYARQAGRVVAFAHAALRQVWAGGRALEDPDTLRIAGAAAEIHPAALDRGIALAGTARGLDAATAEARAAGVTTVPALVAGGRVFTGEAALEDAAAKLTAVQ